MRYLLSSVVLLSVLAACNAAHPYKGSDSSDVKDIDMVSLVDDPAGTDEAIGTDDGTEDIDALLPDATDKENADTENGELPDSEEHTLQVAIVASTPSVAEGGVVAFSSQTVDGMPPYSFTWDFGGAAPVSSQEHPGDIVFGVPGDFVVSLHVEDSLGASADDSVTISVQPLEGTMDLYYGNLHSHSGVSDGEGTPEEIMNWAKFTEQLDFYIMTDHAEQIFGDEWGEIKKQTDLFSEDGVFAALRGFEWSHPLNGHICIYLTEEFTTAYSSLWISYIYDWIEEKNAFAQFNHPGRESGVFNDLALEPKVVDNMLTIETGNKGDGNNDGEFLPYYVTALDKGWLVAPSTNQDNHTMTLNSHRTVFAGETLSRESLVEAMQSRRLYSSDDPDIRIVFKRGDDWMGSLLTVTEDTVRFSIKVDDNEPTLKLQLVSNGGNVVAELVPDVGQNPVLWFPEVPLPSSGYFFLKVISSDVLDNDGPEQIAVTAPIWINKN